MTACAVCANARGAEERRRRRALWLSGTARVTSMAISAEVAAVALGLFGFPERLLTEVSDEPGPGRVWRQPPPGLAISNL